VRDSAIAISCAGMSNKATSKRYKAAPLFVRTDDEVRAAIDKLRQRKGKEPFGVAEIVRAAILEKAARDLPRK